MPDRHHDHDAPTTTDRLASALDAAAGLAVLPPPFVASFRLPIPMGEGARLLEVMSDAWPGASIEQAEHDPTLILVRPE